MTATLKEYKELVSDRPAKFDETKADYRKANTRECCSVCFHLFLRKSDLYAVCEIVRPTKGDEEIQLDYVCQFFTTDGDTLPLLP